MKNLYSILLSDEMESADERRKLARKILRGDMSATVAITPPAPVEEGSARALMRFYLSDASTTRTVQAISVPKYRTAIELLEAGAGHSDVLLKAVTVDLDAKPKPICQQLHQEKEILPPVDGFVQLDTATASTARGITKQQVMNAFDGLHFDRDHWGKNLASPPKWLVECRISKGNKKTSALWNPVLIAAALFDKNIALKKLDAVFVGLSDFSPEWSSKSDDFR